MGLIRAAMDAAGGVFADQWREYFACDAIPADTLVVKGRKRTGRRSANTKGSDNLISHGSVIAVAEGQCMIIVEQGKVVDVCAEPGAYTYDASTEPSVFWGDLSDSIPEVLRAIGKRFSFGGEPPTDQRVYYFNTRELVGNKYGTPSPVPFRVVDRNIGLDVDISIRCFGEYSYRITNPVLFYTNVCGNVQTAFDRGQIDGQLKSEVLTALQPAFARISGMGIRYSALPGHTLELASALNDVLSKKWAQLRGIEIVSFGVSSVKASEADEQMIKDLQRSAAFRDPTMAAARLSDAQAEAMQSAAANQNAGAATAFLGMNMAAVAGGMNARDLYAMGRHADGWTCACGQTGNTGKFCQNCGQQKPAPSTWTCPKCGASAGGNFCAQCGCKKPDNFEGWTCVCGAVNRGRFCTQCGAKKPAGALQYKCDKCGWEPANPACPPKFCPQCGDPFGDEDVT